MSVSLGKTCHLKGAKARAGVTAAFTMLACSCLILGAAVPVFSGAIQMDELDVEGEVQKPEVLFIFDRSGGEPPIPGPDRLKPVFLDVIVEDAWRLANEDDGRDFGE